MGRLAVNPFYLIVLIVGVLFAVTACAYGVMTVTYLKSAALPAGQTAAAAEGHPLFVFLDEHGFSTMMIELAVLGVATVAAIATDHWWQRRWSRRAGNEASPSRAQPRSDQPPTPAEKGPGDEGKPLPASRSEGG